MAIEIGYSCTVSSRLFEEESVGVGIFEVLSGRSKKMRTLRELQAPAAPNTIGNLPPQHILLPLPLSPRPGPSSEERVNEMKCKDLWKLVKSEDEEPYRDALRIRLDRASLCLVCAKPARWFLVPTKNIDLVLTYEFYVSPSSSGVCMHSTTGFENIRNPTPRAIVSSTVGARNLTMWSINRDRLRKPVERENSAFMRLFAPKVNTVKTLNARPGRRKKWSLALLMTLSILLSWLVRHVLRSNRDLNAAVIFTYVPNRLLNPGLQFDEAQNRMVALEETVGHLQTSFSIHHDRLSRLEHINAGLSETIERLVNELLRRHSLDPVGRPDFALGSFGGRIYPQLTSPTYSESGFGWLRPVFGSRLKVHPPAIALDARNDIGSCWRSASSNGQLGIILADNIHITHVTIEHLPRALRTSDGLAPKRIMVWGLVDGPENIHKMKQNSDVTPLSLLKHVQDRAAPLISGGFDFIPLVFAIYDAESDEATQTFSVRDEVRDLDLDFDAVVFEFLDNWGESTTCVYRVRVHGSKKQ
ncbi:hypothetical protein CONPUDRAFT_73471 [Coniophora puteana RWD-64-598 SS2]|uniref:SUN domain-containing protein n=1 Tax=Coniophora puteana (strain RWD-64-598) TaxID=741705 RepID=A0A5M3MMS6_CONPW|nr:uncharacterized protein CONPUDRAFT_73471 [Coniophora puteana RWD-64-598 SS2]EIW80320.1 hypothetical protein CONPUDRAFT_73471 [Coniophora puteana RWD-64-598 SS2]